MNRGIELSKAPLQTPLTLIRADVDLGASQRLSALGLRVGSSFSVISKTAGGGRVVQVAGSRVAVGRTLLAGLRAEVAA